MVTADSQGASDRCKNKESWNLINDISGRKKAGSSLVEGGSAEERRKNWLNHFKNLLGSPPEGAPDDLEVGSKGPPLDIDTSPFTIEELREARKMTKVGKACGDDGFPPEVLKWCDLDDILLELCNKALLEKVAPDQWRVSNIIPVPKKGDLTKTSNYRGISLTSLVAKTLNRMILNRIRPEIEKMLRDNQNGFRQGRSTTSHILALRRILEGAKRKHLPAAMVFVDFKKAFDSLHRGTLMKILLAYGIPKEIVDLIGLLYINTKAKIITSDGETDLFDIVAGVLQGDTLAPYLFIIVLDYCMSLALEKIPDAGFTITPARSRRVKAVKVSDTDFADDIALIADSVEEAQKLLEEVEKAAATVGLQMNEDKTKYLVENIDDPEPVKALSGKSIELKDDFLYLGGWIKSTEKDIKVRKAKAWAACHKLKTVWGSQLRKDLKLWLFTATVESVLLYGSETWTLTKRLAKMVDGCYTRMLGMALNVSWKEHLTNSELYGRLPQVSTKIAERRLRLAGHIHRHPELTANQLLFWEPQHGESGRGRPHFTYIDCLKADTGLKDKEEIGNLMLDRSLWRDVIRSVRQYYPKRIQSH